MTPGLSTRLRGAVLLLAACSNPGSDAGFGRGLPLDAASLPDLPGERRCLSLRVLAEHVAECQATASPLSADALTLAGIGRLEGFYVDREHEDVVLVGRCEADRPSLRLDDLVLALRLAQGSGDPYCSLDPIAEHVLRAQAVLQEQVAIQDPAALARFVERLQAAIGPQQVVVGGVPPASHWARRMIDADYDMKKIAQGKLHVPGVDSQIALTLTERRRRVESGDSEEDGGTRMARFWFHVQDGAPTFLESEGIVFVRDCPVVVLTEAQRTASDGSLSDSGQEDPSARAWAAGFSARYEAIARAVPSCAELENLFRLLAVTKALVHRDAAARAGLDLAYLLHRYEFHDEQPLPPTLPGLADAGADHVDDEHRRVWFASIVCGGVSMELRVADASFRESTEVGSSMHAVRSRASARRPGAQLWWMA